MKQYNFTGALVTRRDTGEVNRPITDGPAINRSKKIGKPLRQLKALNAGVKTGKFKWWLVASRK